MKKIIIASLVAALSLTPFFQDNNVAQANTVVKEGTVTAYWLNVRKGPSTNHQAIDHIKRGTRVTVLTDGSNWDYIQYGNKKGYVYDRYLNVVSKTVSSETGSVIATKKVDAGNARLNVRKGPSTGYSIVGKLHTGWEVEVLKDLGTWELVKRGNIQGYVHSSYLKTVSSSTNENDNSQVFYHTVVSGDTLWGIGRKYGISINSLKTLNKLTSNIIYVGQKLKVSGSDNSPAVDNRLSGKIIVLDPGHGDGRTGAVANGLVEKELNLDITNRVKTLLEGMGANVLLTRTGDTDCDPYGDYPADLNCRPALATKNNAHIFVSIHGNGHTPSAHGAETFYHKASDKALAYAIQEEYVKTTGLHYRRVAYANFRVLRMSTVPSALIETGFLTNENDSKKLKSNAFRDKAAQGIANGILKYFGK